MEGLTKEQMQKWLDLVQAVKEGNLYRMCRSCKIFYQVTKKKFGLPDMCDDCLKGVVIPTF